MTKGNFRLNISLQCCDNCRHMFIKSGKLVCFLSDPFLTHPTGVCDFFSHYATGLKNVCDNSLDHARYSRVNCCDNCLNFMPKSGTCATHHEYVKNDWVCGVYEKGEIK